MNENGESFLIYATEEGGFYKARRCSAFEYERIKEKRVINREKHQPIFIAFARVEANHDFILGSSREEAAV